MLSKDRFVHKTPVRFDDLCIFGGKSARNLHFRPECGERRGKTDHHVVEEYGINRRKKSLLLSRNNLGDQSSQERRQHRFRNPLQPRIVGKSLLPHEPVKFGKCDSIMEECGVFLPQSSERWQIGVFRRRRIPPCPDLRECMFSCRSPENILASIVVCNERMLQTKPIRNRANARSFESSFGELGNGSVENRAPRLQRALLFGSFARTPPPLHGQFHLCALPHVHWLTQLRRRRQGRHALGDPPCPLFILAIRRDCSCCSQRRSSPAEHSRGAAPWQARRYIRRC
jgi:hypothetical protein